MVRQCTPPPQALSWSSATSTTLSPFARIIALIEQEDWKAIDTSAGEFLATPEDTAGIAGWRAYRDAVIGDGSASADGQ